VVSGEAIPLKSALLMNPQRNQRKQISQHLKILELQVEQSRKFREILISKTVILRKIVYTFMKKILLRPWMFQAKTIPSMPITQEGHKSRTSERVLIRTLVVSEILGQI
jgi:hypothetical protein